MAYTDIDKSTDYFETVTYAGGTTDISSLDFQPDWVWGKKRDGAENHGIFDSVRGATKTINSNTTAAESTRSGSLTSFDNDGFTMGGSDGIISNSGSTYVAWCWKAGGSASSNSDGDITSSVSVNTTAGFSVVGYTGNGTAGQTIGHGLGVAPNVIITKSRTTSNRYWGMYHSSLGNTGSLALNDTQAFDTSATYWNNTTPSSSLFTVGTNGDTNTSGTMIAYCFAEKKGYSKFGQYEGNNNADGAFVYTGFKPAFVLIKDVDSTNSWGIVDNKRGSVNQISAMLNPDSNGTEGANNEVDFLSNGFKWRSNDGNSNAADTYIYMAFAESPLVTSSGVPGNAR